MTKKIITGVIAAILVVTIAVFAAEKAREKARACEQFGWHGRLLDKLAEAYKANDREKMGKIINKMYERREKMREFAKASGWHRWAHRRMMGQMGPGWGQGQQMAGPGWNQGCPMRGPRGNCGWAMQGPGPNQGCLPYRDGQATMAGPRWQQFEAMNGCCRFHRGGIGPMAGEFGQMPCQQGGMGMGKCMPQQNDPAPMRGWGRGRFQQNCAPEQGEENMEPQGCNMPRRERQNNVPPPEWGW
jgi:hypothetical protein